MALVHCPFTPETTWEIPPMCSHQEPTRFSIPHNHQVGQVTIIPPGSTTLKRTRPGGSTKIRSTGKVSSSLFKVTQWFWSLIWWLGFKISDSPHLKQLGCMTCMTRALLKWKGHSIPCEYLAAQSIWGFDNTFDPFRFFHNLSEILFCQAKLRYSNCLQPEWSFFNDFFSS